MSEACPAHGEQAGSRSAAYKSVFEDDKIELVAALRLMFSWCADADYESARAEAGVSDQIVADWFALFREVVTAAFCEDQEGRGKIGGPGTVVQIDEAKFGRRKYHKGRVIEGHWVLGMIQNGSEDLRLVVCPGNSRTSKTLTPIIEHHVARGTLIRTDGWRAYKELRSRGYEHQSVNHSKNFVDSVTGAHTQRIEASWRPLRVHFRDRRIPKEDFADHIIEYQWRRWCSKNGCHPFRSLVETIAKAFPL